ncbi:Molybdopterin biosynthesis protein CNX3 [Morus notabilis]|uniref:Molybdopterin biosynthesis protein CNX3 n=1 Tax=Morus notabilis TaxID=981085 RepID=W9S2Q9_9ROSA|nr:Molybdopterin biosynthesis protein CNX3 [Morus notabilis]
MFLRRLAVAFPCSRRFLSSNSSHDLASAIMELNKEMESVFGEPPSNSLVSSESNNYTAPEPRCTAQKDGEIAIGLTHVGSTRKAQMVDVSFKGNSKRTAVASCKVILGKKVYDSVLANQIAKGDVSLVWQKSQG